MADITMCVNTRCPKRTRCYRQTATPNQHRQSMQRFRYRLKNDVFWCDSWWPLEAPEDWKEGEG